MSFLSFVSLPKLSASRRFFRCNVSAWSVIFLSAVCVSAVPTGDVFAQSDVTISSRKTLCVKKIGKSSFGKDKGRDAYYTAGECRKGYFAVDFGAGTAGIAGDVGAQGAQGATGPQGIAGPGGGTIQGTISECVFPIEDRNYQGEGGTQYFIHIAGQSSHVKVTAPLIQKPKIIAAPEAEPFTAPFVFNNVPAGTYTLQLNRGTSEELVRDLPGVSVTAGGITDIGTVEFCSDRDKDGVDERTDCDDQDDSVSPNLPEVCGDFRDNDCDGTEDEGCAGPTPFATPNFEP